MSATPLSDRLRGVMALDPPAPALWFEERWWSWGELSAIGTELEPFLQIPPGADGPLIGVVLRNRPTAVAALLGLLTRRHTVLSLSPIHPDRGLAADVLENRPSVVVADADDWTRDELVDAVHAVDALGLRLPDGPGRPVEVVVPSRHEGPPSTTDHAGVAILMLTSGTTGRAKRIPIGYEHLSHAVVGTQAQDGTGSALRLRPGVVPLAVPLVHISAVFSLLYTVANGRRLGLLERFDVWRWAEMVRDFQIVSISLVPAAMRMVLDAGVPREWLKTVRAVRTGSAPLDPSVAEKFEATYGVPVLQSYGATEFAGGVATYTIDDHRRWGASKSGSIGRPHPGVELRVVDPATDQEVTPGEVGVLWVRSPQVADSADGAWVRTNDLAVIDGDGYAYIRGRVDDVIIRGGFKVDGAQVESTLREHPGVADAAVIGMPDARLGQVPVAAVVLAGPGPASEDELKQWVRTRLAPYTVPARIQVVDEIPRNAVMKPVRVRLLQLFGA